MKKFLSTFLAVTLLVTSLLTIPFTASAIITNPVVGSGESLSLSFNKGENWFDGKQATSSGIVTVTLSGNKDYLYTNIPNSYISNGILAYQNASVTDLINLEWTVAIDMPSLAASYAMLSHVDTDRTNNPTVLNLFNTPGNTTNCIAVAINNSATATASAAPSKNMRPNSITVFVPDVDTGALVPLNAKEYTADEVKAMYSGYTGTDAVMLSDEDSYLSFGDAALSGRITFTVKLYGNKLTVTAGTLSKTFTLPYSALQLAPSGDIAIAANENSGAKIRNIAVTNYPTTEATDGLIFDSTELDKDGAVWLDNNNAPTDVDVEPTSKNGAVTLPGGIFTSAILKNNGYTNTKLTDFVWDFQYKPGSAQNNDTSFIFHLDSARTLSVDGAYSSVLATGEQIGIKDRTGLKTYPRLFLAATMHGYNEKFTTENYEWPNAITLDYVNQYANHYNVEYNSKKPVSYLPVKTVDDNGNAVTNIRDDVYYNVKIAMSGNVVTYSVWQEGFKDKTYASATYFLEGDAATLKTGEFAISQNTTDSSGSIKNMKVYTGNDIKSAEDYSKYEAFKGTHTFDTDVESLYIYNKGADCTMDWADGQLKVFGGANGTLRVRGFDKSNNNLGDFITKFDISCDDSSLGRDDFIFRRNDGNFYRLRLRATNDYGPSSYYGTNLVILERVYDSSNVTELARAYIGYGLTDNVTKTVKVSAIGNEIKVWIAEGDTFLTQPLIEVVDDAYSTGIFCFDFYKTTRYIDNFEIYDITAYNLNAEFEAGIPAQVQRGEKDVIDEYALRYAFLPEAQRERLAAQKTKMDAALVTLEELEDAAHDLNGDDVVDILDLVLCSVAYNNNGAIDTDPYFDDELNTQDLWSLRRYILGLSLDPDINVLTIGNSYSIDMNTYVGELADSLGYEGYNFHSLHYPGRSVANHFAATDDETGDYKYYSYTKLGVQYLEGATIKSALDAKDWDIIIFQTSPVGAALDTENADFDKLIDYVRSIEGNEVKFMWENSWAYASPDTVSDGFVYNESVSNSLAGWTFLQDENGNYSQEKMDTLIEAQLVSYFGENGKYADYITLDDVVPVGLSVKAARNMDVDFALEGESFHEFTRDGYHLSYNMGRYIAAMALLEKVTGDDIVYTDTILTELDGGTTTEELVKAAVLAVDAGCAALEALK